ncbi:mRNA turnover 4 [Mycoblastus sanguinarius]|nr:mRNA turnover 4 [Mycoblastus sanguinarius]
MPKSKRAKVVHMSKVTKKGKELTLKLYANVQECIPKYAYIYVFSVHNMRNTYLKDVRTQLSDSRLFFGKTKVMAVALGLDPSTEPYPQTSLLTPHLSGSVGLLFSPRKPSTILSHFADYAPLDYARAGTVASRTFTLPAGILYSRGGEIPEEEDVPLAHSVEPNLRKLWVPTRLVKGKVELDGDFVVCREGEVLGSGQTTILKQFGVAMAEFRVGIEAYWERETGEVTAVGGKKSDVEGMDVDEDDGQVEEVEA